MAFNKTQIIELLCKKIEDDLTSARQAATASHLAATGPESKAENQYDTRGLEASYLAGAQAKRAAELEDILFACKHLPHTIFVANAPIALGALIHLEHGQRSQWVLLVARGAGISLTIEDKTVQTITTTSPLGETLIGLKQNDLCEVEQGNTTRTYKILSIE